jgi:16S rRNA A1518/A1519 N6-dimethyltransferase RsmA/KsgA/DIM1 with predicted DNA glycosylase/AP lyase activity
VPPESFDPPPRVDSAVVRMVPHSEPANIDVKLLEKLVQVGRDEKLAAIKAEMLKENRPMQRVSEKVGFQPNIGLGFRYKGIQIDYALTNLAGQNSTLYSNVFSVKVDLGQFRN